MKSAGMASKSIPAAQREQKASLFAAVAADVRRLILKSEGRSARCELEVSLVTSAANGLGDHVIGPGIRLSFQWPTVIRIQNSTTTSLPNFRPATSAARRMIVFLSMLLRLMATGENVE